jgi:hypothetical protein
MRMASLSELCRAMTGGIVAVMNRSVKRAKEVYSRVDIMRACQSVFRGLEGDCVVCD